MGELVVWRWSIYPHLTRIAKCIAVPGVAPSISRADSIRESRRA
jgi:hypothetical protein